MYTLRALTLSVALSLSFAIKLTRYTDCGGHGHIESIVVEPCSSEPCQLQRGHTYSTAINFTAQEHTKTLTNICHGIIAGVEVPFPISPSDACGNGVTCPITPGQSLVYRASVTCPRDAPLISLATKWEVRDQNNRDLICIVFPLEIRH